MKDFKYIIKRILIGVGIAICMYFFRNYLFLNTYALEVSNYGIGNTDVVIDNTTTYYQKNISGNPWSTYAGMSGYVTGSFALQKVNGSSTSINVFPTQIFISTNTGYQDYVCDIGTAMEGNSTFNGGAFTYRCPIKMGTNGVTRLVFQFQNIQTNYPSSYRLSIGSGMSFEIVPDTNVNIDTSGTTNAINNQTESNNHNRDANFGNLIQDNRNNTQAIVDSQQDINNTLNDSSTSDPNSDINSMSSKVASNNSITQLLTLPITLFQNVLNNINGTCSSYSLGSLYNHNLSLPCINLENILGSTLWGVIDILISGLFILSFRKKMVDIFNHMSSLNDRGNELE